MSRYSEKVRRLVAELPRGGDLESATHRGSASNPVCGDRTEVAVQVEEQTLLQVRVQASGCPAALAGAAGLAEMVEGMSVRAALGVEVADLIAHLDGLPSHKEHGAEMAVHALRRALVGPSQDGA